MPVYIWCFSGIQVLSLDGQRRILQDNNEFLDVNLLRRAGMETGLVSNVMERSNATFQG